MVPLRPASVLTAWLMGCGGEPGEPPDVPGRKGGKDSADTGEPPGCLNDGPCSVELAAATWSGGRLGSWTGQEVRPGIVDGVPVVLVGAPNARVSTVTALRASNLDVVGTWDDPNEGDSSFTSGFGGAVAVDPNTGRVAVGARSGSGTDDGGDGVVYAFDGLPAGPGSPADADLTLIGDFYPLSGFGSAVAFLDLTGSGIDLVVGTSNVDPDYPSAIFRFDALLTGTATVAEAAATVTGAPIVGGVFTGWDADGDGLDELVSSADDGVIHFPAPWVGDLLEEDADVLWSERDPSDQLSDTIETLDDLDGDGRSDLAITANTYSGQAERAGAAYLVPGGPIASGPADALPFRFLGTEIGEGFGSAATSGDFDGDGQPDLLIGAYGLVPGRHAGKVLGFLGPLEPGVRTAADADFVVHGERAFDWFGAEAVAVDADGDARDDLVVSAQNWEGRGKVYLLLGSALLP